jgi:hypothetical protein
MFDDIRCGHLEEVDDRVDWNYADSGDIESLGRKQTFF